jgi:hypothetical protein
LSSLKIGNRYDPVLISRLVIFNTRNSKTKIFFIALIIVSLLLILVVIKIFEKRIQKIDAQEQAR